MGTKSSSVQQIGEKKDICEKKITIVGEDRLPFYVLTGVVSLVLLFYIPSEASIIDTKKGWFLQPMVGPALGLSIMALFSAIKLAGSVKLLIAVNYRVWFNYMFDAMSESRVPIIVGIVFYVYINSINVIGFFLSTFLFACALLYLSNLLNRFWLLVTFLTTLSILLIFRMGIGLWMEDVWLYGLFPDQLSEFANSYF